MTVGSQLGARTLWISPAWDWGFSNCRLGEFLLGRRVAQYSLTAVLVGTGLTGAKNGSRHGSVHTFCGEGN